MARERMVTRTVETSEYVIMAVNGQTRTVENVTLPVPSASNLSDKQIAQYIREHLPNGYLFVQTLDVKITETLYGMSEDDFIKYAKVLPPRGTKTE